MYPVPFLLRLVLTCCDHGARAVFSPVGKILATSIGSDIALWDAATRFPVGPRLTGDQGTVESIRYRRRRQEDHLAVCRLDRRVGCCVASTGWTAAIQDHGRRVAGPQPRL